jgi:hypothetical protein
MQTYIVKKMPSLKAGYIDPWLICASNFQYPKDWPLDDKELAGGETVEEKEKIWTKKIYQVSLRVACRIAKCLKNLQHNEMIWLPYHFG